MKWNENEIKLLMENFDKKTNEELSLLIGRSKNAVFCKLNELGLRKPTSYKSNNRAMINKKNGRDLSKENVHKIALLYNSRGEFKIKDQSAYNKARKEGYLEEICTHMTEFSYSTPQLIVKKLVELLVTNNISYNNRKIIKPYELDIYLPDYNLAFEYDGLYWHKDEDDVRKDKICKDHSIILIRIKGIPKTIWGINYEKYIKEEFIKNLDLINRICKKKISPIMVNETNISSCYDEILTKQKVTEICNSYYNYWEFQKEQKRIYQRLRSLNKLEKYTSHMKRKFKQK